MLARNFESFHLYWESESDSLILHYERSLGTWAAQLCSGVRGDSTFITKTWLMDRLLVSDCLSLMLSDYLISMNKPYICLFRTLLRNTWCQDKSFSVIASTLGLQGAGSTRAPWRPLQNAKQPMNLDIEDILNKMPQELTFWHLHEKQLSSICNVKNGEESSGWLGPHYQITIWLEWQ